jgi:Cytochrome c7 and related cytochrome c
VRLRLLSVDIIIVPSTELTADWCITERGAASRGLGSGGVPQIFRPSANSIARTVLFTILIGPFVLILFGFEIMRSPYTTGEHVTLRQPVPFSHKHHVGDDGIDCRYCHTSVETSAFAGLPPTTTCMTCHSQLFTNARMLAPIRQSFAEHKPIHWVRVHRLPAYVYFDHSVHIANGVGCTTCHGPVQTMPLMSQYAPLTMSWCLDCHRNPAPNLRPQSEIFDVHWKPPADQLEEGKKLLVHYHINTQHLTDCYRCHR